jgi:hypothetical protein
MDKSDENLLKKGYRNVVADAPVTQELKDEYWAAEITSKVAEDLRYL